MRCFACKKKKEREREQFSKLIFNLCVADQIQLLHFALLQYIFFFHSLLCFRCKCRKKRVWSLSCAAYSTFNAVFMFTLATTCLRLQFTRKQLKRLLQPTTRCKRIIFVISNECDNMNVYAYVFTSGVMTSN